MWSWAESTKASLTSALEKTGDALSKAASQKKVPPQTPPEHPDGPSTTSAPPHDNRDNTETHNDNTDQVRNNKLLGSLQAGWTSVVGKTRESWNAAQGVLEDQQNRLQERINEARHTYYKRDPKSPLDTLALRDAQVVYITDRLILMSHPAMASSVNSDITGERKLAAVGHLLSQRHNGRFMVWNISEVDYETRILDEQVLTFSFPGSPSPPLGMLLKLLTSIEGWLKADDRNVAVVHCLTGKGRSGMVLASFLCWMGQAGFHDMDQALQYIAACKQMEHPESLVIPSQRRYASYFKNMLDGVRPSQPPLLLQRIIMSEAPRFTKGPPRDDTQAPDRLLGCAPYLQLFKAGDLLHTAPASLHYQQSERELPFVQVADGSVSFNVNIVVQGDILIRCRHLTSNKKNRISMFRAAFHTGYVPPKVLRLKKSELDGACDDERFPDEFFIDLIFEAMDAEEASKLIREQERQLMLKQMEGDAKPDEETNDEVEKDDKNKDGGEPSSAASTEAAPKHVSAAAYDIMLHRESRFWDVVSERRNEPTTETKPDPTWGPTIGRRRDFDKPHKSAPASTSDDDKNKKTALETFSIGGEFDFLPQEEKPATEPKRDSLMEALMGALGESSSPAATNEEGPEVVIFDHSAAPPSQKDGDENAPSSEPETASTTSSNNNEAVETTTQVPHVDEVAALLADANLELDGDVDALLAGSGAVGDLDGLDDLDELDDLESFLAK